VREKKRRLFQGWRFELECKGRRVMKALQFMGSLAAFLIATSASAEGPYMNLTGQWQCVALCLGPPGSLAFITQNGWDMNIVNDAGVPSRAWIDYPGHIWVERANDGAVYSPDGLRLQFDRGAVWQRAPVVIPPPPLPSAE
jgi:hypothetical protein